LVPNAVDDEVVGLTLTGALADGTLITGIDSITLQAPKPHKPSHHDHDRDGKKADKDKKECGKGRK
jgi:hypothetical protein